MSPLKCIRAPTKSNQRKKFFFRFRHLFSFGTPTLLSTRYPNYELVVSEVHDYYNLPVTTFACKGYTLVVHISFYIKPINQEPLLMYDVKTIPVLYHMNEELIDESESKYTYTKIKPPTRPLAMGSNSQIHLDYSQLVHCIQYNIQMFLTKIGNEHTCESAIYTHFPLPWNYFCSKT